MPFENLNSNHYTVAEKTAVNSALAALETALSPKFRNLSPEERKKYGSINEQNKLVVNKVNDYRIAQPNLSSPDVDWTEFQNDFESRAFIQGVIARLESIMGSLENNKILHDFDNYQAALTDYGYSQYKAGTKSPGFEVKIGEISQFFNRTGTVNAAPTEAQ